MSRDPLGLWGDPGNVGNPYSFAGNDPVNRVDPFGLESIENRIRNMFGIGRGRKSSVRAALSSLVDSGVSTIKTVVGGTKAVLSDGGAAMEFVEEVNRGIDRASEAADQKADYYNEATDLQIEAGTNEVAAGYVTSALVVSEFTGAIDAYDFATRGDFAGYMQTGGTRTLGTEEWVYTGLSAGTKLALTGSLGGSLGQAGRALSPRSAPVVRRGGGVGSGGGPSVRQIGGSGGRMSIGLHPNEQLIPWFARVNPLPGYTDILMHGEFLSGRFMYFGGRSGWSYASVEQIALIVEVGGITGNIRLITCYGSALGESSMAYALSARLGTPVLTPTVAVEVSEYGALSLEQTGAWIRFSAGW